MSEWTEKDEKRFIEGLGGWKNTPSAYTEQILLQKYIDSHQLSPYPHHKAGVIYAKKLLAKMVGKNDQTMAAAG